jgi:glycosyltransferase involved in cell wall biosynthesis
LVTTKKFNFPSRDWFEILKNAKKIVFLSIPYKERLLNEYVPEDYKKTFEDKSVVIPNGINKFWHENTNNNPISTDINTNNIRALYAGEIRRNKNIDGTIKALQILNNKGYNFHFDIVGMGLHDQKSYLRTIIKTANKTNFITLHPVANQAGLLNFYRNSHLFIMPSFTESFGLVYLEALSQGVPVIYSINEGFDKSFENGVIGSSADPHNPDSIATAIEKVLNDYRQIQRNCIEAVNRFDWEIIAEDYIRIYNEIN